jgi:pimeloyl-[acyl-carrier protein] methyl ester esterase
VVTEIIFQHGWAFDSNCWREWLPAFSGARILMGERGYFGATKLKPTFSADATTKIVIAHSFGAHLLDPTVLRECDTLVLVAGFVSIKKNARAIKAMLNKFPASPDQVIVDFWTNSYAPELTGASILPPPGLNEVALEDDLQAMLVSELDAEAIRSISHVVLVNAGGDRILPRDAHELLQAAVSHAEVAMIGGGSHALPLTQAQKCIQLVSHWIPRKQLQACQPQKL